MANARSYGTLPLSMLQNAKPSQLPYSEQLFFSRFGGIWDFPGKQNSKVSPRSAWFCGSCVRAIATLADYGWSRSLGVGRFPWRRPEPTEVSETGCFLLVP